jgi:hypothetical protein
MKKLVILATLAFALTVGTAAVMTVYPQQAVACNGPNC